MHELKILEVTRFLFSDETNESRVQTFREFRLANDSHEFNCVLIGLESLFFWPIEDRDIVFKIYLTCLNTTTFDERANNKQVTRVVSVCDVPRNRVIDSRVRLLLPPHFANDVCQCHYVILGQRQRFNFAEFPLHFYVRYNLP